MKQDTKSPSSLFARTTKKLELIDGIWVSTEMHITKKKGKLMNHKTILKLSNVKFNQDLGYDLFTIRRMEKGL